MKNNHNAFVFVKSEEAGWTEQRFAQALSDYNVVKDFPANGNVFDQEMAELNFSEDALQLMRWYVEYHVGEAFAAMKILQDANTEETPKRIAKVWCGDSLECDTELGGGRFSKPVRLPVFPNTAKQSTWITKKVRLISTCSHHFIPFTGEATISYMPGEFVLGISKLQRLTNYVANRFWLQEDLTHELHRVIAEAADVPLENVTVNIVAKHGCEMHRGVKNENCEFTTEA